MKKTLSVLLSLLLVILTVFPAFAENNAEIVLADNGATEYSIVVSDAATKAEMTAANTLKKYLEEISGAQFPVVTDAAAPAEKELVVGVTNRDGEVAIDRSEYRDDGVRILSDGEKLFLTGGAKRGAVYAVYTFLEDFLGCRWFTTELTVIPAIRHLAVAPIDYTYVPCFDLRQTYWNFSTKSADFCAAHKLHGVMAYLSEDYGGCAEEYCINSVHTLQWIITRDMFDSHPEYFGCDDNGTRSPNRQPCLSNDDVLRLVTDYAKQYFATYNNILSISQNDGMSFCQCDECKAFNKAHGNTDAASMVNFVNKVAEEVRKTYPDARFETLAYQDSLLPPENIEIADGIVIRMCPVNGCVLHDFDDPACKKNAEFNKAMQRWAELTDTIYMWNYSTNFQYYYAPFPNIGTLQARYRYFRDNNVVGVFDNGCGEDMVAGEFHDLKTYLVLKLMWDPDTDIERHISEFCAAYYGEAAGDVIEFIRTFEKAVKGYNPTAFSTCHMTCQDGGESLENHSSVTAIDVKKLDKIMETAESRTLTAEEANRLEGLSISWRFFKNATFSGEFSWFSFRNDPAKEAEQLYNDMMAYGIEFLSEGGSRRLDSGEPDFTARPTWWFSPRSEMPLQYRIQSVLLPVINRILRAVNLFNLFKK